MLANYDARRQELSLTWWFNLNTKISLVYMSADENSERKWFDVELHLQFEQVTL